MHSYGLKLQSRHICTFALQLNIYALIFNSKYFQVLL